MQIQSLCIRNFKSIRELEILDVESSLILVGKNNTGNLISLVAQMKGRKVLVKGNHDDISDYRFKQLFAEVCDYKELSDCFEGKNYKVVLSHYPILMWNGQHKGSILLYGHTHQTVEDTFFQECIRTMNEREDILHEGEPKMYAINVGCMWSYIDYEPRSLKELLVAKGLL